MLDFSVLVRDEDGRRKSGRRRRRRGLSSVRSKPWKLETTSVRLDLAWSASQLWYGAVPLPLTIGFSALLSSSYRFFLSAKISLQSPLTGDISGRFSVFPFLSFPFLPFPSLSFPFFLPSFLPSFSPFPVSSILRCGVSKYQSMEEDSLPAIPLSLVSTTSRNQLFFESPSDGRTSFVRSGYSFVVYKSSSAIRKSFKSHSLFFSSSFNTFFFPFLPSFLPSFLSFFLIFPSSVGSRYPS